MEVETEQLVLSKDQFRFRKNMCTKETMLSLRIIVQKRIMRNKHIFKTIVAIEISFDNNANWGCNVRNYEKSGNIIHRQNTFL